MAALDPAADPAYAPELGAPWRVAKVYWSTISRSVIQGAVDAGMLSSVDDVPNSLPDEEITAVVDGRAQLGDKIEALRAHRSQVDMTNGLFAVVTSIPEFAVENYVLVRGERGPGSGRHGWEDDLFAGVDGVADGEVRGTTG
jgi:N-acetyl-1-D-myo-inositol-2-amino-2-deoxy-alpha-D-glucopyranoside deacetylase